jgi:hypothetical protein
MPSGRISRVDHFAPGVPFSLTGHSLRPFISGGPGSANTDEAQRRLLVAMAARRHLHGNLLCLEGVVEAGLLGSNSYEADLANLVGRLSVDGLPELAQPTLDAILGSMEAYGTRGWVVPWGLDDRVDGAQLSRRPPWLDRLKRIARGLSLVFVEGAPPEVVAVELDVPWPLDLPWSAQPEVPAGVMARRRADKPALIGAR